MKSLKDFFTGHGSGPVEFIVVGLGNPGKQYENTRHNAGFLALDYIAGEKNIKVNKLRFKALCGDGMLAGKRVLLMKPSTFMNNSGEAVRDAMRFYKIPMERVIVISDDVALDVGQMRIRRSGSDGGQKGLRSIITLTGRDDFPRIRIGVGKKPYPQMELSDWVLSRFSKEDAKQLAPLLENTLTAVELLVQGKIDEAMNKFN